MLDLDKLKKCTICPHKCGTDRTKNIGRCKSTDKVKIALYSTHNFEEPCISGEKGSGTIFFSNCNLNCVFCQNYEISQQGRGKEIEIEELAEIMVMLADLDSLKGKKKDTIWNKAKNILSWLGDKAFDVGIAVLPYIMAALA